MFSDNHDCYKADIPRKHTRLERKTRWCMSSYPHKYKDWLLFVPGKNNDLAHI